MKKLSIETHGGPIDVVEVVEYNASEVAKEINNSQEEHVIAFGDHIYSKINIKTIKPYKEESDVIDNG